MLFKPFFGCQFIIFMILEKADILELTVRHIQKLSQNKMNPAEDINKFRQGYTSCANEAAQFLLSLPGVDCRVGQRLVAHLMGLPVLHSTHQPIPTLLHQRMMTNLLSFPSHHVSDSFPRPGYLLPGPCPPGHSASTFSTNIKSEQQVISASQPMLTSKQIDLLKPVPVKPSPFRLENKTPPHDVWKPYSS